VAGFALERRALLGGLVATAGLAVAPRTNAQAPLQLAPEAVAHGFYTTRWVVAVDEEAAVRKAFGSARRELSRWSDVRDGLVAVEMVAEEVDAGSWWRWLKGGGRGFTFFTED